MKVFVLTEINLREVGFSPRSVQVFWDFKKAAEEMKRLYYQTLKIFCTTDKDTANVLDEAEGLAYIGDAEYRLNLYECELDLRDYIHDIQEMTVVAEAQGVRTELMERGKSRPDVWFLMQKWADEFMAKYENYDYAAHGTSLYDEIDDFMAKKWDEYKRPKVRRDADYVETDFIEIVDEKYFGDSKPHSIRVTTYDGVARADGITLEYPKVWALTDDQIREIDEYTGGRITDSGVVNPWDVCVKFGKIVHFGVISTWGDGHNPDLVARINRAWVEEKERFKLILQALYERDIDEITDADCFFYDQWKEWPEYAHGFDTNDWRPYNKRALEVMKEKWDFYADNYLDHIADDADLSSILFFLHR